MPFIPFIKDETGQVYLHNVTITIKGTKHTLYVHPEMVEGAKMAMTNELMERLIDQVHGLPKTEQTREMAKLVVEEYWQSVLLAGGIEF